MTESRGKTTGREELLVQTYRPMKHMQLIHPGKGWGMWVHVCMSIKCTIRINKKETFNLLPDFLKQILLS